MDTPTATAAPSPEFPASPSTLQPAVRPMRPSKTKLWSAIIAAVAVVGGGLIGAFCYIQTAVTTDHAGAATLTPAIQRIVQINQKLIIGTDDDYQPMEFIDSNTQQRVGYDIDLGKAIAQELNVPVLFHTVNFDSIFATANLGKSNDLTTGKVDLLLDSVTITAERQKYYLFSNPYLNVGQVALTLQSNTSIHTKDDLKNKRLSVASSTSNEVLAKTLTADSNILRFTQPEDQAQAVLKGQADAMLLDLTNAQGIVSAHPQLKIATDPMTSESYGIVVAKGKADLVTRINQILDTLKQRGVLESLHQKWFE